MFVRYFIERSKFELKSLYRHPYQLSACRRISVQKLLLSLLSNFWHRIQSGISLSHLHIFLISTTRITLWTRPFILLLLFRRTPTVFPLSTSRNLGTLSIPNLTSILSHSSR